MSNILAEKFSDILLITINRPQVFNAIDFNLVTEFKNTIDTIANNDDIRSVIITGNGEKAFSSGGDLKYVEKISPTEAINYATHVHQLLNKLDNLSKPIIAAINGFALGGGCQIALTCDLRIASENAKIGQTEVKIGICPGWGATQRLSRIIGVAKAKEMIFTGKILTACEAFKIGLVDQVVKSEDNECDMIEKNKTSELMLKEKLIEECMEKAKTMNKNNFKAIGISKMLINKARDLDINTGLFLENLGYKFCLETR